MEFGKRVASDETKAVWEIPVVILEPKANQTRINAISVEQSASKPAHISLL